jgi:hypothetical protein
MLDCNNPTDSGMADNRSEAVELSDNFVRFWLWVLRNYRNYAGADERVQIDLTLLAHLCLRLRLMFILI